MRIIKKTDNELVISAFSRWLLAAVVVLGLLIAMGLYVSLRQQEPVLAYVMIPVAIVFVVLFFAMILITSRATFSRKKGTITLRTRNLLTPVRRTYGLDFFRFARVHTLKGDDPLFEIVLVFSEQILYDPDLFDSDGLVEHRRTSAEAGRAPNEISMTAGSDTIFSFQRKQEIVEAINDWADVSPNLEEASAMYGRNADEFTD